MNKQTFEQDKERAIEIFKNVECKGCGKRVYDDEFIKEIKFILSKKINFKQFSMMGVGKYWRKDANHTP